MQEQLPCRGFNLRGFLAQLGEGPGPLQVFLAYPGRSFARVAQLQGWTSLPLGRRYPQLIPSRCFFEFVSELQDSRDIYAHGSGNPFEVFLASMSAPGLSAQRIISPHTQDSPLQRNSRFKARHFHQGRRANGSPSRLSAFCARADAPDPRANVASDPKRHSSFACDSYENPPQPAVA